MTPLNKKIHSSQAVVNWSGGATKNLHVTLRGDQKIADVLAEPSAWLQVQGDGMKRLAKGDTVTIVSPDGLAMADSAVCIRAEAGNCWFSKPLRLISFETVALYSDGRHEVVAIGTHYGIRTIRDGNIDYGTMYPTPKAAEVEIARRSPVRVA